MWISDMWVYSVPIGGGCPLEARRNRGIQLQIYTSSLGESIAEK
jgi:hypothetical protein